MSTFRRPQLQAIFEPARDPGSEWMSPQVHVTVTGMVHLPEGGKTIRTVGFMPGRRESQIPHPSTFDAESYR